MRWRFSALIPGERQAQITTGVVNEDADRRPVIDQQCGGEESYPALVERVGDLPLKAVVAS
jgi:hypothetical protein